LHAFGLENLRIDEDLEVTGLILTGDVDDEDASIDPHLRGG
jgi:hypothetical protein